MTFASEALDFSPGSKNTVAIAGLGTIGRIVAKRLDEGLEGLTLVAAAARDEVKAGIFLRTLKSQPRLMPLGDLAQAADIVVECLPADQFDAVAEPALRAGRTLVAISVGAILDRPHLTDLARRHGGRIVVPTGALLGLDAVQAAAEGTIRSVRMVTRKPPSGLAGAPYLLERNISLEALVEPRKIYEGPVREAVRGFPANVNVAAALSLAGIGPDKTIIEIWADPHVDRNRHQITVDSDSAWFSMEIANIPSDENPKTGKITALSVVSALRKLRRTVAIGT